MKKMMKNVIAAMTILFLAVTFVFAGSETNVYAATSTSKVPITCYTISTGRTSTYELRNGRYSYTGYIDGATDCCTILQVRSDGYCKVKYPVARGYRTAYAPSSAFFVNTDFSTNTVQLGSGKTAYRRSNLSQKIGSVYANDNVIIVGTSGNITQVIYPVSGGYKLGWVSGTYRAESSSVSDAYIKDGYYQIKAAANQNYVLDVYNESGDNGANVQLYQNHCAFNQGFLIKKCGSNYYTITALHSGKNLDVENSGSENCTNIIQWNAHGGDNQQWRIVKTSDGYYSFISKCNGLYMDYYGGVAGNEVNIEAYTGNNTIAQKFVLEDVTINGKAYGEDSNSGSSSSDTVQKIVNYELSQVGTGDYRGNNNVKYNTWYYGRTINGSGYAWCMAFQSYCANECSVLNSAVPKTASCSQAVSWYNQRGQFHLSAYYGGNYTPKAGDLVFYGSRGSSHVGMIVGASVNGYLQVVEGNVRNDRTGNYTVQHFTRNTRRRVDSSYVYGYASPTY